MEEKKIKRFPPQIKYPILFYPKNYIPFSLRYIEKITVDDSINLKEKYEKLKNGINYKTGKKIQYGKETYIKVLQELKNYVLLLNTREKESSKEDLQVIEKINDEVNKVNNLIEEYNERRDNLVKEMGKLKNWKDFIVFENKKYGLFKDYYPPLHLENDCYGIFKTIHKEEGLFYKIKNYLTS